MRAIVRRILATTCCIWTATGCSGVDTSSPYEPVYYGADWYYGDDWSYIIIDDDISLPDRPGRPDGPVRPEHPIVLPPKEAPPSASQLPSGIKQPSTFPRPGLLGSRPSFSAALKKQKECRVTSDNCRENFRTSTPDTRPLFLSDFGFGFTV